MPMFKGREVPFGHEVEVTISTQSMGLDGVDDAFYGMGIKGEVVEPSKHLPENCLRLKLKGHGFFGAWDNPDAPVSGKPVYVILNGDYVEDTRMDWSSGILRVGLTPSGLT